MKRLKRNDFSQRLGVLEEQFNVEQQGNAVSSFAEILEAYRVIKEVLPDGDKHYHPTSEQMQAIAELLPNIPADRVMHVINKAIHCWHYVLAELEDC